MILSISPCRWVDESFDTYVMAINLSCLWHLRFSFMMVIFKYLIRQYKILLIEWIESVDLIHYILKITIMINPIGNLKGLNKSLALI